MILFYSHLVYIILNINILSCIIEFAIDLTRSTALRCRRTSIEGTTDRRERTDKASADISNKQLPISIQYRSLDGAERQRGCK